MKNSKSRSKKLQPPPAEGKPHNRASTWTVTLLLLVFLVLAVAIVITSQRSRIPILFASYVSGGDFTGAKAAIPSYGCGACHTIPGIPGATGQVGPDLSMLTQHLYIAGKLPNTADNLVQWIQTPQEISPGVDMPDMGVTSQDARDIAAYLYSIR